MSRNMAILIAYGLSSDALGFLELYDDFISKIEKMIAFAPASQPFSVMYNRTSPKTDYVYRNFLPLNTPRGSNIGICNFKKI